MLCEYDCTDDRRWAVVETNPAWCANPYWATEHHAQEVVAAILSSQGWTPGEHLRWLPPGRKVAPVPLPLR